VDVAVAVVGGQGPEIMQDRGYSLAKQNTECDTHGIDLVFKSSAGGSGGYM
jgi:hypothetical protein